MDISNSPITQALPSIHPDLKWLYLVFLIALFVFLTVSFHAIGNKLPWQASIFMMWHDLKDRLRHLGTRRP